MKLALHLFPAGFLCIGALLSPAIAQQPVTAANQSFELPATSTYVAEPPLSQQSGEGWVFYGTAGISHNNSELGLLSAPNGDQAAYLQNTASFSQPIAITENTVCTVAFSAEASSLGVDPFMVTLDGIPLLFEGISTITPTSTGSFTIYKSNFASVAAGPHTLAFVGLSNTPTSVTFIDDVSVNIYPAQTPVPTQPAAETPYVFNSVRDFTGVQASGTRAVASFNSTAGFSGTQGLNGWSYASVHFSNVDNLEASQTLATFDSTNNRWNAPVPGGAALRISATQQEYCEGDAYFSLRYWTADKNYASVKIDSILYATKTVGAFVSHVSASTHLTTRLTPAYYSCSASEITNFPDQTYPMKIDATVVNVEAGDRIYFVMQNYGNGSNGSGVLMTWEQSITCAGTNPNQWSYGDVYFPNINSLSGNILPLTYNEASATWSDSHGIKVTKDQQNMTEGASYFSLRYWTADQDYASIQVSSTVSATNTAGWFLSYVDATTQNTSRLTSTWSPSASQIAAAGGTLNHTINATVSNVHRGDQIFFVMQNYGNGSNGNGVLQAWQQTITTTGPMHYGVHAQARPDPGLNFTSAYLDKANSMNALAGSGFVVRDFIQWPITQPNQDTWNWSLPDAAVAQAKFNNQKIIFCLCFTPSWANGGLDQTNPATNSADWQTFVQACANRYKESGVIAGWELWNEENSPLYFDSAVEWQWIPRAQDYANKILIPGYTAIRAVDSITPVLFGGMNCGGIGPDATDCSTVGFLRVVLETGMASTAFDWVGYHPYLGNNSALIPGIFDQLRCTMQSHGINKQIVCTEWGALVNSANNTGVFLQLLTTIQAKGASYACYHYAITAEGSNYGLFNWAIPQPTSLLSLNENDWTDNAYAYNAWIQLLGGYKFQENANFMGQVPANTVGYTFSPSPLSVTNTTTVVWNYTGNASVQILIGAAAKSAQLVQVDTIDHQLYATPIAITETLSGKVVTFSVNNNPIFLQVSY